MVGLCSLRSPNQAGSVLETGRFIDRFHHGLTMAVHQRRQTPTDLSDKGCGVSEGVDKAKGVEGLDFEQALAQLNDLVGKLEAGELPLEESVAAFETGVKLSRRCETLLDSAEQRLQVLSDDQDS